MTFPMQQPTTVSEHGKGKGKDKYGSKQNLHTSKLVLMHKVHSTI